MLIVLQRENRQWLAGCSLTPEPLAAQMDPLPVLERTLHLNHYDHRGLPLVPGGIPYRYDSNYLKQFQRFPCSNKR